MENILEINGLCKNYEGFSLKDVSFSLPKGYIMGFVGQNGSGKTTTLNIIASLAFVGLIVVTYLTEVPGGF